MKKLINDPADLVAEALRGMAAAHPAQRVDLKRLRLGPPSGVSWIRKAKITVWVTKATESVAFVTQTVIFPGGTTQMAKFRGYS